MKLEDFVYKELDKLFDHREFYTWNEWDGSSYSSGGVLYIVRKVLEAGYTKED